MRGRAPDLFVFAGFLGQRHEAGLGRVVDGAKAIDKLTGGPKP